MKDVLIPFSLRMSDNIRTKLEIVADENERSLNGQIVTILKDFLKAYEKENGVIKIAGSQETQE